MIRILRKDEFTWQINASCSEDRDFITGLLKLMAKVRAVNSYDEDRPLPLVGQIEDCELERQEILDQRLYHVSLELRGTGLDHRRFRAKNSPAPNGNSPLPHQSEIS